MPAEQDKSAPLLGCSPFRHGQISTTVSELDVLALDNKPAVRPGGVLGMFLLDQITISSHHFCR